MKLDTHPTVVNIRRRPAPEPEGAPLDADEVRRICLEAGADDAGCVELERPELAGERDLVLSALPGARTLVGFVLRMNRDAIRSPARSVANVEFHHTNDETIEVARRIAAALEQRGWRALAPAPGFPMELDRYPGRAWVVSHKRVAVAAGLGQMGIHRNVIHPRFGNFILLGTVITDAPVRQPGRPIDFNPCLECKLCVAACPVGAIGEDGRFNLSACYTHNYREFMGGFSGWVEEIANARDAVDYRSRVSDAETASMWQSLSFGANYKAAYCMAVCPAGEDVIAPWLADRKGHLDTVVKPLRDKPEPVYVVPGSDAEAHVIERFPKKTPRRVPRALRSRAISGFLFGLTVTFQPRAAQGVSARFHFTFTGREPAQATVEITGGAIRVTRALEGTPDVHVTADSDTWLGILAGEKSLLWALLRRRVRVKGPIRLLRSFRRCFA